MTEVVACIALAVFPFLLRLVADTDRKAWLRSLRDLFRRSA